MLTNVVVLIHGEMSIKEDFVSTVYIFRYYIFMSCIHGENEIKIILRISLEFICIINIKQITSGLQ